MTQYRQGDVLIESVSKIETGTEEPRRADGAIVLVDGEATGHAHVIREQRARAVRTAQALYLVCLAQSALEHEEHSTIILPVGNYRITRQREYTPEEIRNVAD